MNVSVETLPRQPAAVAHFRREMAHCVEHAVDGVTIVDAAAKLYAASMEGAEARETSLTQEVARAHADDRTKAHMLAHIQRTVAREVEIAARQAAHINRYRDVETKLATLADQLQTEHPEIADRIHDALASPQPPDLPARPVVVAFHPDTRYRCGWFRETDGYPRSLAFAGWCLMAAAPSSTPQQPEAAFTLYGRPQPLSELERRGMVLVSLD